MTHEEQKDYANAKYDVIKALDSIRKLKPEYQKQLAEELFVQNCALLHGRFSKMLLHYKDSEVRIWNTLSQKSASMRFAT